MTAYYNEFDPKAAAWLRELIARGHIAPGDVDERSIADVRPVELMAYTQCHFFAGIGVWSYALRRAGWADDRPVWTGSCPCQPFSAAGKGGGFDDERHLWPHFHWLIAQCRPDVVFGEQVASKDGLAWVDLVSADLEGTGYANGALDFCSAGVGAPHIRQRLYWFGERLGDAPRGGRGELRDAARPGRGGHADGTSDTSGRLDDDDDARLEGQRGRHQAEGGRIGAVGPVTPAGEPGGLADHYGDGCAKAGQREPAPRHDGPIGDSAAGGLANAALGDKQRHGRDARGQTSAGGGEAWAPDGDADRGSGGLVQGQPGPVNGFWGASDWLHCRDHKWRPVEPGTFPLAHGAPARVGRLRGYGNAINAEAATLFIEAYQEAKAIDGERLRLTPMSRMTTDTNNHEGVFG